MAFNPLKILPFFIFQKISLKGRNNPEGILKINKYNDDDELVYDEHIVNIREIFHGQYMFTTENFELEQRRACLKKELDKVEEKLK
jgi:hypothetical protein